MMYIEKQSLGSNDIPYMMGIYILYMLFSKCMSVPFPKIQVVEMKTCNIVENFGTGS